MVTYECYRCGYQNTNKSNLVRHLSRKNTCKPIKRDIDLNSCKEYILNGVKYEDYLINISNTNNLLPEKDVSENNELQEIINKLRDEIKQKDQLIDDLSNKNSINIGSIKIISFNDVDLSNLTEVKM